LHEAGAVVATAPVFCSCQIRFQWLIIHGRLPAKALLPFGATMVDLLFLPEEQQLHPEGCALET